MSVVIEALAVLVLSLPMRLAGMYD